MRLSKKIAIVYDWIDKIGGVERMLVEINKILPHPDFFSSVYDSKKANWAKNISVKTSFINNFPNFIKKNRLLSFIFYPFAFEAFDFSNYDLVISITSSFAKAIITKPDSRHICILLTPTRYLWLESMQPKYFLLRPYISYIKNWDFQAAQRPDKIIAISENVAKRCKIYYQRESSILYPAFNDKYWSELIPDDKLLSRFSLSNQGFYLLVSRLEPYKKVDLAIKAFNHLQKKLIIAGVGSEINYLRSLAGNSILILGKVTDNQLISLYQNAKALIMPQEEDFGYVALEAQFFGCPVIAFGKGGALETVIENKTGIFFNNQTVDSMSQAVERYDALSYNIRKRVRSYKPKLIEKYSSNRFKKKFLEIISEK